MTHHGLLADDSALVDLTDDGERLRRWPSHVLVPQSNSMTDR